MGYNPTTGAWSLSVSCMQETAPLFYDYADADFDFVCVQR